MKLRSRPLRLCLFPVAVACAAPATAGWKVVPAHAPAQVGTMAVVPLTDWNRASAGPSKLGQIWTHDGFGLNGLELFAAVPAGQSLYKERDAKRNPMPKFAAGMLLPDLTDLFERSFRAQYALTDFTIEQSTPATLGGVKGISIRYRYSLPDDELSRSGEARLAIANGKLYVVNYYAPSLHYFDAGLAEAHAIMDSAKL